MKEDNSGKLIWFIAGAAIGASIALLYAPASGEHTRKRLGEGAKEGREKLTKGGRELYDKGRELYDKGREMADQASDLIESGRKLVQG